MGVLCLVFVLLCYALHNDLASFAIILTRMRESFVLLVSLMSVALSNGAVGWFAVCDCFV